MERSKVLLVDDEVNILEGYKRQLRPVREKIEVLTVDSGAGALDIMKKNGPVSVVVSDYRMPEMNGIQLLEKIGEDHPETVRLMLTGQADFNSIIEVINRGHVFRFLTKPCTPEDLLSAIMAGINQYNLIQSEKILLNKTLGGSVRMMVDMLSLAKPMSFNQSQRIKGLVKDFLDNVNIDNKWQIEIASMLAFVGCVTVPDSILEKIYNLKRLTPEENKTYMNHTSVASEVLSKIPRLEEVARVIKYQEKDYSGKGFPIDDIHGDKIPLGARVLKIFLDFDRLMSSGMSKDAAIEKLSSYQGKYDPKMFTIIKQMLINRSDIKSSLYTRMDDKREEVTIDISGLKEGMVLAQDIESKNGELIASAGQAVNAPMKVKISNYAENNLLAGEIRLYK